MEKISIPFKGWNLVAWINEKDGDHMIAVKPIAEAIGVDWRSQRAKIKGDSKYRWGDITSPSAGGPQEMLCLPVRQLNGWLYGINSNKVKPEIRKKLLDFQEECHMHLHNALSGRANMEVVDLLQKIAAHLSEENEMLKARVTSLEEGHSIYNDSEQLLASVGGKMLARAKKTKHLRQCH